MKFALWALLWTVSPAGGEQEEGLKAKVVIDYKDHYKQAFTYFTSQQYSQAIAEWNKILEIDPSQKTAQKMIREARKKIDDRDKKNQTKLFDFAAAGQYHKSYVELQALLEKDPTHPLYIKIQKRLELLSEIVPKAPDTPAWKSVVRGLTGFIGPADDMALAYNGLRNAIDLAPGEKRFLRIEALILREAPQLATEKITPGMKLLEYKRFEALNNIYDGKYHLAIKNLNEVLALAPNDLVSLKRLGSAYYALKRYERAEDVWTQALKLAPQDKQLKKFLTRAQRKIPAVHRKKP